MNSISRYISLFLSLILIATIFQGCSKSPGDIAWTPNPLNVDSEQSDASTVSGVNLIPYSQDTVINPVQSPWRLIGPGGGGAIFVPTVSFTDPKTAMVACDMTGTYITHDGGKQWKEVNLRSRVDSIAFDPKDSNTIYAASTGLFKSTDNGDSWKLIYPDPSQGLNEKMVGDHAEQSFITKDNWPGGTTEIIYIDPLNTDNIYLGIKTTSLSIYYSKDKGKSWSKGPDVTGTDFKKMYMSPDPAAANHILYVFTDKSICRIDTSASSLTPVQISLQANITNINSVACGLNPDTKNSVMYITTSSSWSGGTFHSGIMKSTDNGASWSELQTGLNKDLPSSGPGKVRQFTSLATSINDARIVYAAVERAPDSGKGPAEGSYLGIFKSSDEGNTWDWTLKVGSSYPSNISTGWYEHEYNTDWVGAPKVLAVSPSNPDALYFTGIGMAYNTMDGGKTWNEIYSTNNSDGTSSDNGLEVTTSYGVHFDPFDKNHMVISYTDIGMAQSFNGGASFSHAVSGVPDSWKNTCYWMVFDPAVKGKAWSVWSSAHDLPREKMFRSGNPSDKYVGGVCKSTDGIKTWQKSNTGLPDNTIATDIILDPKSPAGNRTLYVAALGKGVYKSVDDGKTWTLKSSGISGNLNAWRLVLTSDGTLYLLTARGLTSSSMSDGAIYKSTDGAENWVSVTMPEGVNAPNDMISDPGNARHLYLAAWPKVVNGISQNGGLYETKDGGSTWTNLFDQTSHVYSVAMDPNNSSTLYIVTFEGAAWRSDDSGKTWNKIKGYDFKWGHRPIPDPYNKDMLYITTFGSSVWYGPAK